LQAILQMLFSGGRLPVSEMAYYDIELYCEGKHQNGATAREFDGA